jgi:hypothetical protein
VIEVDELAVAFGTMGDVMPLRIVFDRQFRRPFTQLAQERAARTAFPLWVRVVSEDGSLNLLLESVKLYFGRLFRLHRSGPL